MLGLAGSRNMGDVGVDFAKIWNAVISLPATQKDVASIAKATETVQSKEFQKKVAEASGQLEDLGKTFLVLNAISTAAMVGMFVLQLREATRR